MSDSQKQNRTKITGYWMPMSIRCCPVLSPREREIIAGICQISSVYQKNGGCTHSNEQLAYMYESTALSVSIAISKANKLGWVIHREDQTIKTGSNSFANIRIILMAPSEEWRMFGEIHEEARHGKCEESAACMEELKSRLEADKKGTNWEKISKEFAVEIAESGIAGVVQNSSKSIPPLFKNLYPPYFENPPLNSIDVNNINKVSKDTMGSWGGKSSSVSRKRTEPPIPYEDIKDAWNIITANTKIKAVAKMSDSRRKHIKARSKDFPTLSDWKRLFRKVLKYPFLCGESDGSNWIITFDWIVANDNNPAKVLEGVYERGKSKPKSSGSKPSLAFPASPENLSGYKRLSDQAKEKALSGRKNNDC